MQNSFLILILILILNTALTLFITLLIFLRGSAHGVHIEIRKKETKNGEQSDFAPLCTYKRTVNNGIPWIRIYDQRGKILLSRPDINND